MNILLPSDLCLADPGHEDEFDVVEVMVEPVSPDADAPDADAVAGMGDDDAEIVEIEAGVAPDDDAAGTLGDVIEVDACRVDPASLDRSVVEVEVETLVLDDPDHPDTPVAVQPASPDSVPDPEDGAAKISEAARRSGLWTPLATGTALEAVARLRAAQARLTHGEPPPPAARSGATRGLPAGERLAGLEELLGYRFRRPETLRRALIHSSSAARQHEDNERMEFLGDAVLDLVIREFCYHQYPDRQEGELTEVKSAVVCCKSLARVGRKTGLTPFIHVGRDLGKRRQLPDSTVADAYEALVAALYLDGGYAPARRFVLETLGGELEMAIAGAARTANPKSLLQQHAQARWRLTPQYRTIGQYGPDHSRVFEIAVLIDGREYGRGRGLNKKDAEQAAARVALDALDAREHTETAAAAND